MQSLARLPQSTIGILYQPDSLRHWSLSQVRHRTRADSPDLAPAKDLVNFDHSDSAQRCVRNITRQINRGSVSSIEDTLAITSARAARLRPGAATPHSREFRLHLHLILNLALRENLEASMRSRSNRRPSRGQRTTSCPNSTATSHRLRSRLHLRTHCQVRVSLPAVHARTLANVDHTYSVSRGAHDVTLL